MSSADAAADSSRRATTPRQQDEGNDCRRSRNSSLSHCQGPGSSFRDPSLAARRVYGAGHPDWDQHTTTTNPQASAINHSMGWVDEGYREENPWHGEAKNKPIFSLGRPLPHQVRGPGKSKPRKDDISRENLAEQGELGRMETSSVRPQSPEQGGNEKRSRRTAAGVSHGGKTNDAGQPVFDYLPSRTTEHAPTGPGAEPDFKIDSEPLGRRPYGDVDSEDKSHDEYRNWWARIRARQAEPLAEFLATGMAVFLGLAGTLSVYLSQAQSMPYGTYETACWAWGFAWMFGIYLGGGVSGAHMNPAISISLFLFRGFPWHQCILYVIVQFVASIVAGALAYGVFADTIHHMDPTMEIFSKAFLSTPQEWVSPGTAFLNQAVGAAIMMIAVFALGDDQNNPPGAGMHAFVLGLLVTTLKFTLGFNVGSALNPASDFGPRVIAYAVGYRQATVFNDPWWIYGPWASTLAGSLIGCVIYDGFIFVGSESPVNYRHRS